MSTANTVLNSKGATKLYKWGYPLFLVFLFGSSAYGFDDFSIQNDWMWIAFLLIFGLFYYSSFFQLQDEVLDLGDSIFLRRAGKTFTISYKDIIEFEANGVMVTIHHKNRIEPPNKPFFFRSLRKGFFDGKDLVRQLNEKRSRYGT